MRIDARGKQCPVPVIMAKKELDANVQDVEILVDGQAQVDNLARFGDSVGRPITSEPYEGKMLVRFSNGNTVNADPDRNTCSADNGYAVFFNRDAIGTNEGELGKNLAKMAILTLSESEQVPDYVLFMNEGVKLVAGDCPQQNVDCLNKMIAMGTEVLVCGTCLDFFGIKDDIRVGTVSNMYDILGAMQKVGKMITL